MEQLSEQRSGQPVRPIHDIHRRAVLAETARTPLEGYKVSLRRFTTERFPLACGSEGELAGVPAYVKYQPKWFKAEGVLDEAQSFERDDGERSATASTEAHHDDSR
jgi:hypothetical protein